MIPKKINVGYKEFKIKFDKDLLSRENVLGQINHRDFTIRIQSKLPEWNENFLLEVLAHEFAHAYYLEHNHELNTEDNCDKFASMFMMMAKNMKWLSN